MLLIKIIPNGPSGPRRFADAGFEPGGQIFEMNVSAAVEGGVVVIPVLPFADACVDEMETCAIVQRWLRQQAYEEPQQLPPFNPTLLASRRDAFWILSSLAPFYEQRLIADVLFEAHSGE